MRTWTRDFSLGAPRLAGGDVLGLFWVAFYGGKCWQAHTYRPTSASFVHDNHHPNVGPRRVIRGWREVILALWLCNAENVAHQQPRGLVRDFPHRDESRTVYYVRVHTSVSPAPKHTERDASARVVRHGTAGTTLYYGGIRQQRVRFGTTEKLKCFFFHVVIASIAIVLISRRARRDVRASPPRAVKPHWPRRRHDDARVREAREERRGACGGWCQSQTRNR